MTLRERFPLALFGRRSAIADVTVKRNEALLQGKSPRSSASTSTAPPGNGSPAWPSWC